MAAVLGAVPDFALTCLLCTAFHLGCTCLINTNSSYYTILLRLHLWRIWLGRIQSSCCFLQTRFRFQKAARTGPNIFPGSAFFFLFLLLGICMIYLFPWLLLTFPNLYSDVNNIKGKFVLHIVSQSLSLTRLFKFIVNTISDIFLFKYSVFVIMVLQDNIFKSLYDKKQYLWIRWFVLSQKGKKMRAVNETR